MNRHQRQKLADEAWTMCWRTRNAMPVLIARDWVMEHLNCERAGAARILAMAARRLLEAFQPWRAGNPESKTNQICRHIGYLRLVLSRHRIADLRRIRTVPAMDRLYDAWCDLADRVVNILWPLFLYRVDPT